MRVLVVRMECQPIYHCSMNAPVVSAPTPPREFTCSHSHDCEVWGTFATTNDAGRAPQAQALADLQLLVRCISSSGRAPEIAGDMQPQSTLIWGMGLMRRGIYSQSMPIFGMAPTAKRHAATTPIVGVAGRLQGICSHHDAVLCGCRM